MDDGHRVDERLTQSSGQIGPGMKCPAIVRPVAIAITGIAIVGIIAVGARAQGTTIPADATPGDVGISGAVLGAVAPVAAPGYRLQMTELVWEPGAYSTSHSHPLAQVACVLEGSLGMSLQEGAATLTRGGDGATPVSAQPVEIGQEIVLGPRDCVSYDENAKHTVHTVWNASDGTTRMWMADLVRIGEPYTTYANAAGTPVP